jgi:hypothetical protein
MLIIYKFLFQYSSPDEAEETVAALDGVRWPSTNPKQVFLAEKL